MFFLPSVWRLSCLPKGYFLLSKSDGDQKAKSGAKNTLCTQRKIFRSNAMDDLVFEQSPALPLQNNIRSGKAGEKKSVTQKWNQGGMAWGYAVYGNERKLI
ncbi:MAG: hypothetical protein U0K26_01295 [Prevotella pectinovora]|jgi:hypothetical protein|uniref:hypothetical protein n=2 Tax=Bacteroidales TaxID=171549 RepID=UPI002E79014A|nr:hypothetical protein [Prevotella pectinovora]MEE1545876.1 hypothetical protein [Prevotella pectinovora]